MNWEKSGQPTPGIWEHLTIVIGDITDAHVDAIVNAASHSLLGLAGVSGAIFRAAGPGLYEECSSLGGCPEGGAKMTAAYQLSARHVIHTVGPIWRQGTEREEDRLAQCYRSCFELIEEHGHHTIAFPSIGTGAHGFPVELASRIAIREMAHFLACNARVEKITIVCFEEHVHRAYLAAIEDLKSKMESKCT